MLYYLNLVPAIVLDFYFWNRTALISDLPCYSPWFINKQQDDKLLITNTITCIILSGILLNDKMGLNNKSHIKSI